MGSSWQTVLQYVPSPASVSARVHHLIVFNICDCYVRRPDQAERIIGTLLGSVLPDSTIDIRNSYAVPHNESSGQVALDIDYHQNMLTSHQKVNPKEVIVGWFSTSGVIAGSALIHEFYSREVNNPIHLTVDTEFRSGNVSIKAFVSVGLSLGDQQLVAQFQEIPLDLHMVEEEREEEDDNMDMDDGSAKGSDFKNKIMGVLKAGDFEGKRSSKLAQADFMHLLSLFNRAGIHFS